MPLRGTLAAFLFVVYYPYRIATEREQAYNPFIFSLQLAFQNHAV